MLHAFYTKPEYLTKNKKRKNKGKTALLGIR